MDELAFIREQVRTERRHMAEVRQALGTAIDARINAESLDPFCAAAVQYLLFAVRRFNAQDQAHCDQLRPRLPVDDKSSQALLDALGSTLARSRVAIDELANSTVAPPSNAQGSALVDAAQRYLAFYREALATQQGSLYPLFEKHYRQQDWRAASMVDADSVLEERRLYAAVRACLPDGVELKSAGRPLPPPA